MKNKHITKILDDTAFDNLSENDSAIIKSHIAVCQSCRKTYQAAQISAVLLKSHAQAETFEPSPFFHTKVMAALRERQEFNNPIAALRRMWQAARTMVAAMVLTVAALIVLTFAASNSTQQTVAYDESSGENVFTSRLETESKMTNEQVFEVILDDNRKE